MSFLLKLIPSEYLVPAGLVGILLLSGLAGWAGWAFNGWRLGAEIAVLETNLKTARDNAATLSAALSDQAGEISRMKSEANARRSAAKAALQEAGKVVAGLEEQIEVLRRSRGSSCEDAEKLINEALRL